MPVEAEQGCRASPDLEPGDPAAALPPARSAASHASDPSSSSAKLIISLSEGLLG